MSDLIGRNRRGNALLCYFHGEADRACVSIAKTTDEVRKAIAEFWLGVDVGDEIEQEMRVIAEHDFEDNEAVCFEFEIGGARFEDVSA